MTLFGREYPDIEKVYVVFVWGRFRHLESIDKDYRRMEDGRGYWTSWALGSREEE